MKKVLVLLNTPGGSMYGASKSFRAHYDLLKDHYEFKVVSQLGTAGKSDKYKFNYGAFFLIRNCLGFTFSVRENLFTTIKLLLGIIYLPLLILKARSVDIIHLNSLTLIIYAPLLKYFYPEKEIICHVREIKSRYHQITNRCLDSVNKIICIDDAVKNSLSINEKKVKVFVVRNPVIIRSIDKKFNFDVDNYVNIGVIGRLSKEKKTIAILDYIKSGQYKSKKPIMVHVVGGAGADTSYYDDCKMMTKNLANTRYLGEIDNLENTNFYEQLDCLLRFDDHYSVGRTILEAINFGVDIYTEKDISRSILDGEKEHFSSRFFSLEKDKNFYFEKKIYAGDFKKTQFTEQANKLYVSKFVDEIYV